MHHKIAKTLASCLLASSLFISTTAFSQDAHSHGGIVKETMDAGGYTYILVTDNQQETWVALPPTKVKVGETVKYIHGIQLENFASKTLNRTFKNIVFSEGLESENPQKTGVHGDLFASAVQKEKSQGSSAQLEPSVGSSGAVTPLIAENIAKATGENAYTVGELYSKRLALKDSTVRIQGEVVKVTPNIMGKNWIHLQDGSGDPIKNTHDLVITSSDLPAIGSVVAYEGKVTVDRDFGYSYQYDLLVEEAHRL